MPEDYSKHLEKRIKEMRERMVKSKLHSAKGRKYWYIKSVVMIPLLKLMMF